MQYCAALLIRFRPTKQQPSPAHQLVTGYEPDIYHLRVFGCAVYVSLTPPQRQTMGLEKRLGIYVGYESSRLFAILSP